MKEKNVVGGRDRLLYGIVGERRSEEVLARVRRLVDLGAFSCKVLFVRSGTAFEKETSKRLRNQGVTNFPALRTRGGCWLTDHGIDAFLDALDPKRRNGFRAG